MRLSAVLLPLSVAAIAAASPALANERVDACALAAMAVGARVDADEAIQSSDEVSFAVPPMVNQAAGIGCVFDTSVEGIKLSRLFWQFPEGTEVDINVAPINFVLGTRFAAPISSAHRIAMSMYELQLEAELAFTCAAWANVDEGRSIDLSEIERLTLYGYDIALELADTIDQEEKVPGLSGRAPPDFWVGVQWMQTNEAVNRGLEHDVPNQGQPYEEWLTLRAENASANFLKQSCADVGR